MIIECPFCLRKRLEATEENQERVRMMYGYVPYEKFLEGFREAEETPFNIEIGRVVLDIQIAGTPSGVRVWSEGSCSDCNETIHIDQDINIFT